MVSKEEIFALYLNTIFLGNRAYGVEAAADKYFAKSIEELSLGRGSLDCLICTTALTNKSHTFT